MELLKVLKAAHVREHILLESAILVDAGHRRRGWSCLGHDCSPLFSPEPGHLLSFQFASDLTEEGLAHNPHIPQFASPQHRSLAGWHDEIEIGDTFCFAGLSLGIERDASLLNKTAGLAFAVRQARVHHEIYDS